MTVRPIIFSGPMVRALLEGRKTQTRRLAWRDAECGAGIPVATIWQRVKPGDLLWVKETHSLLSGPGGPVRYYATDHVHELRKKRSSIHMPRWASRLTLQVVNVMVQRLQDISQIDAIAEGVPCVTAGVTIPDELHVAQYADLWERLHGKGAWAANPTVVAVNFGPITMNIDDFLRQQECPTPAGPDAGTTEKGESGSRSQITALKTEDGRGGKQPASTPR